MGRQMEIEWQESEEELKQRYRRETHPQRRTRLQALWLLRQGMSMNQVSFLIGVHYRTLQRWTAWYREGGVEAVLQRVTGHHATGQPTKLTTSQTKALLGQVASGVYGNVREVIRWVEQHWGVRYTYQGMYSLLKRHRATLRQFRPQSVQINDGIEQKWKKVS